MTELNWDLFSPLFGDWASKFKKFFDDGGFDPVYAKLKDDSSRGRRIAPLSSNVFRCFKETSINNVKVILLGYCPYHTFTGWSKRFLPGEDVTKESKIVPVSDGLLMSCSVTGKLQPSLSQFYDALIVDVMNGNDVGLVRNPDLSYLAKQGVLLLNAGLTVEEGKPGNHNAMWEPFMKYLFEEVMFTNAAPVVLLGREAQKMKRYIMPFTWTFELTHPASAAYNNTQWCTNQTFTNINKILKDNNNDEIKWIQTEQL